MFSVKNISKSVRKFTDNRTGITHYVNPKEQIEVSNPPKEVKGVWEIKKQEKKINIEENK